jgi:proteasome accessory factor C
VPYADDRELIMDIMKYGSDCEVIEPGLLKARVAAEFESGLAKYRKSEVIAGLNL